MRRVIYVSGPITDNATGLPREGWEKDFRVAEKELRAMGFDVISPVDIARKAERMWKTYTREVADVCTPEERASWPEEAPRWYCIDQCLRTLSEEMVTLHVDLPDDADFRRLVGLCVIGDPRDVRQSFGTMCEVNYALSAGLPVWSRHYRGLQVDNSLRFLSGRPTLQDAFRELNGRKEAGDGNE